MASRAARDADADRTSLAVLGAVCVGTLAFALLHARCSLSHPRA